MLFAVYLLDDAVGDDNDCRRKDDDDEEEIDRRYRLVLTKKTRGKCLVERETKTLRREMGRGRFRRQGRSLSQR